MAAVKNLYLPLCMMRIGNESLELRMWNIV
jgi:hypothetical protein